jgi:hypothetical protein
MRAAEAAARDTGAALALNAEALKYEVQWAISKAAQSFRQFTSDDVWGLLEAAGIMSLDHPNAMGAQFLAASRAQVIRATGRVQKSVRTGAHRRNIQVWESLIFVNLLEPSR